MNRYFATCIAFSLGCNTLIGFDSFEERREENVSIEQKFDRIDSLMKQAMESLKIPGFAVGIVMDGKIVFTKGYGVRKLNEPLPVTENTLFAIGSCSKAFTTFALGQLVDIGSIAWDDPVIKYLPEFRLQDLHATHHLTIRDLVTHRSGLPRHDFAWYNSTFPRSEILKRLEHLEPTCDLREKFQYNNLMYAVAGIVIEKVTGQTWEEYVAEHIFKPLGMDRSNFSVDQSQLADDFSFPHTEKKDQAEVIPFRNICNVGPAGSINSSIGNMMKWVGLQLSDGMQLINPATLADMHVIHMPMHLQLFDSPTYFGYGLGWVIGLHKGHLTVTHGGGIDGFISCVAMFPKEKIGVVVLTNSDSHGLFPTMAAYAIADLLMGAEEDQWLAKVEEKEKHIKEMLKKANAVEKSQAALIRPFESYTGEFEHPGYGTVQISLDQERLAATLHGLQYLLEHKTYDHFTGTAKFVETQKFSCSFVCNPLGEISEFHLSIEPQLPPIVFKRKVSNELIAADYLKKFVGNFECSLFSMEISLKKGLLTATVPGQPSCEMKPEKENLFSIKQLPDCRIQFIADSEGKISELQLHQAGQIFTLKAKE